MGLFDSLAGGLKNLLSNDQGRDQLLNTIGGLINNPQTGGLPGLVGMFKEKGFGDTISSWISTGKNLPISADQIQSVLGSAGVQKVAQSLGVSPEEASGHLAEYLPKIIDAMTPNGSLPSSDSAVGEGLNMLKGKLFGS